MYLKYLIEVQFEVQIEVQIEAELSDLTFKRSQSSNGGLKLRIYYQKLNLYTKTKIILSKGETFVKIYIKFC